MASRNATIANGQSLSGAVHIGANSTVFGIQMPSSWTAANLTFQASVDNSTYNNVYDVSGAEYTVTAGASRFINIDPAIFAAASHIKVRSGTSGSAVAQGAERVIGLAVRKAE